MAKKDGKAKDNAKAEVDEKPSETTVEFLASLAAVLVTGLFIITFVVQAFEIPSSSMEETLLIGDHVFVNRIQFAPKTLWTGPLLPYREVRHGDIVVFLHPDAAYLGTYVVKRIMGLPGDRIHLINGVVYRNGEKLDEPYIDHDKDEPNDRYRNSFPAVAPEDPNISPRWETELPSYIQNGDLVVPPGMYFMMGDHRHNSLDSRFWGFVPRANVVGRPLFNYWSFKTPDDEMDKTSMGDRMAWMGHVVVHFFTDTRWSRTLHLVK